MGDHSRLNNALTNALTKIKRYGTEAISYLNDDEKRGKVSEYTAGGIFLVGCGADVVVMLRDGDKRNVPRLLKTVAEGALAVALLYDAIKR